MFARVIKGRSKEYVSIIKGYRDKDGKVKHKTVYNLGEVNDKTREATLQLAKKLIAFSEDATIISSPLDLQENKREFWGAPMIIDALWQKFALDQIITNSTHEQAIKLMLVDRLLSPTSKLKSFKQRDKYHDYQNVQLQHLYRALDYLDEHKQELQQHIYDKQKLYGDNDVVFFDVTSLHFESQQTDELRDFGFSKDCKFNEVQVVLSLVVDKLGRPLAYDIFPGNCYEGKTLLPCLLKLKDRFAIDKVVIVADRGISSAVNLELIKAAGFEYVLGWRLRTSSLAMQKEALNDDGYSYLKCTNDDQVKYKFLDYTDKKLLCLWSSNRAKKDAKDRQRLLVKAMEMINEGKIQDNKRGAKKYIKETKTQSTLSLDLARIEKDASFDGYYALSYSDSSMTAKEIAAAYHNLWRIEESFRTLKSFFDIRPMFHYTPKRISGHVLLNFIALALQIDLELAIKTKGHNISHEDVRHAVNNMQRSLLTINSSSFYSYANLNEHSHQILTALNITPPKNTRLN